jgi:hypothetical protein
VLHGLLPVEVGVEPPPLHEVPLPSHPERHAGDVIAVGPGLLVLGVDVGLRLAHPRLDVLLEEPLQSRSILEQPIFLRGLPPDGAGLEEVSEGVVGLELDELAGGAAGLGVVEAVQRGQARVELGLGRRRRLRPPRPRWHRSQENGDGEGNGDQPRRHGVTENGKRVNGNRPDSR